MKFDFTSGEHWGFLTGPSLQDYAIQLYEDNDEVELICIEALQINHQPALLVTTESIFGIGQFYLFNVSGDTYLIFNPIPITIDYLKPQVILDSIAFMQDVRRSTAELQN